jgi:hypothetical protein
LLTSESLNIADRYIKGEIGCYLRLHSRLCNQECDLVFISVEGVAANFSPSGTNDVSGVDDPAPIDFERDKGAVFLGITKLVESPQIVIPSFVWLLRAKQRNDFRGAIFADLPSVDIVIELDGIVPERKIRSFQPTIAASESGSISGLVESGTEIVGNIEQDARQHFRHLLSELNLVDMISRIRVLLDNMGVWLTIDKIVDEQLEIANVLLCSNKGESWAVEQVRHDSKTRSDERPGISEGDTSFSDNATQARMSLLARKPKVRQKSQVPARM